jgi:hypothetical protein
LVECSTCHDPVPGNVRGGPHGLHPIGAEWVAEHGDVAEHDSTQCRDCHGQDYRSTVLSRSHSDWTVDTGRYGTKSLWRGSRIGCYLCHRGPDSDDAETNQPAQVTSFAVTSASEVPTPLTLVATDVNGDPLELRVVEPPRFGTVALTGTSATYRSFAGFVGFDHFTYAAWDGKADSNLGMVELTVEGARALFADGFESGGLATWSSATP